jgi:hypothetical protein
VSQVAQEFSRSVEIVKVDDSEGVVYGWASVITDDDGAPVVDHQGDIITAGELTKAAHEFVLHAGVAGEMHKRKVKAEKVRPVGRVAGMLALTADVRKAFGLGDSKREGLIVAFKIDDAAVLAKIKSGELGEMSIGGVAERVAA